MWKFLRERWLVASRIQAQIYRGLVCLMLAGLGVAVMVMPGGESRVPFLLVGGFLVLVAVHVWVRTGEIARMRP